ncbi:ATP-grasp domain-containing protein, partial [Herbaspirillum sp. HC18]
DLTAALERIGCPAILKTTRFGYDGKGQALIREMADAPAAWEAIGGPAVLEGFIDFTHEFSILVARGLDGTTVRYDPPHNVHRDAILRTSTLPAPAEIAAQAEEATALALRIAEELGYVGVLACEFFATANGPVFNEMAPRV